MVTSTTQARRWIIHYTSDRMMTSRHGWVPASAGQACFDSDEASKLGIVCTEIDVLSWSGVLAILSTVQLA